MRDTHFHRLVQAAQITLVAAAWMWCGLAASQGIYTCTDGKGRKITSDRPIAECTDRTQQELNSTGTVKRVLGPSLTAQERAVQDEKDKVEAEARGRQNEEKRRDRALLLRYPNRAVHDKERVAALAQIEEVIKASSKRATELGEQRKAIDLEYEFYKVDPAKAPASLKRQLDENEVSSSVQKRFLSEQDLEKKRVNARFDEELVKLGKLWALGAQPTDKAGVAATGSIKK